MEVKVSYKVGVNSGMGLPMLHKMSILRHTRKVSFHPLPDRYKYVPNQKERPSPPHPFPFVVRVESRGRIQRKTWCMGAYAGVVYNLTLCRLQSRV
jgi:hypothetical protein